MSGVVGAVAIAVVVQSVEVAIAAVTAVMTIAGVDTLKKLG